MQMGKVNAGRSCCMQRCAAGWCVDEATIGDLKQAQATGKKDFYESPRLM